jgi:stearoyl-CoA desaturase (delta-9 desaturase)
MLKKICWPVFLYIAGYHLFLLIALPLFFMSHTASWGLIGCTVALVLLSGFSITTGYHRLFAHNTYKAHPIVEVILLFFASLATQGSALQWSYDHRLHHAFVDQDKDPYTVKRGFWHAHIIWMFFRKEKVDPKVVSDLWRSKLLRFQHKYYALCMVATNVMAFLFVGWLLNDYLGAFIFAWWVRTLVLHHTTWCINSVAHYWGTQHYSREHTAVDNYLISLITYGEGYHNYHHTFAHDYRNGIRWYHFDPAKWLIWTLHKFGLAYDLKKVNNYRIARELLDEHKNQLLQKIKNSLATHRDQLEVVVSDFSDTLSQKLVQMQKLLEKYREIPRQEARALIAEIKATKKELKMRWKAWDRLLRFIDQIA